MNHIVSMHVLHCKQNLPHVSDYLSLGQVILLHNFLEELTSSDKLHYNNHILWHFEGVNQPDQTLVMQLSHHANLLRYVLLRLFRYLYVFRGIEFAICFVLAFFYNTKFAPVEKKQKFIEKAK